MKNNYVILERNIKLVEHYLRKSNVKKTFKPWPNTLDNIFCSHGLVPTTIKEITRKTY